MWGGKPTKHLNNSQDHKKVHLVAGLELVCHHLVMKLLLADCPPEENDIVRNVQNPILSPDEELVK